MEHSRRPQLYQGLGAGESSIPSEKIGENGRKGGAKSKVTKAKVKRRG